jgi:hypothetical protein
MVCIISLKKKKRKKKRKKTILKTLCKIVSNQKLSDLMRTKKKKELKMRRRKNKI